MIATRGAAPVGAGGESTALAYLAPDDAFAIYNDYATGRSEVRRPALEARRSGPGSFWGQRTAARARPYGPPESVEGYGVFTFPYGPISMGVPESGRFDVRTYGERVLAVTPVVGYKARQILSSIVGLPVADAALRVERLAGNFSAAHAAAFLLAAESAGNVPVPREALWIRALGQELQRVYNHVHVLARLAEAAAQNVGAAQAHALAEEILRLQGRAFGHRWLFGAFLPGGPARHLTKPERDALSRTADADLRTFERLWELFLGSRTFVDRIQSTGTVARAAAIELGAVGPTLRACGVPWDDRLRVPTEPYTDLYLELPQETGGDALARLLIRADEVRASFLLVEQLLDRWPTDAASMHPPPPPIAPGRGIGRVESPSGDLVYDVTVEAGTVRAAGMRSASEANLPLFAQGLRNGVFTDFHFAWESFGLVFAEVDG